MKRIILFILLFIVSFSCTNKKVSSNYINGNKVPIISIILENDTINMLMDTGASLSMLDSDYAKYFLTAETEGKITGIGGSVSSLLRTNILPITIDSTTIYHYFIIKDISDIQEVIGYNIKGIIGSDILFKYRIIIDMGNRTINVPN